MIERYTFYVACEPDEDIGYLSQFIGEDHLVVGFYYGHTDPSSEGQLVATYRGHKDLSPGTADKLLGINARRLYGI